MIVTDLKQSICLKRDQYAVYQSLAYFRIFHYPLTRAEIQQFSSVPLSVEDLDHCLAELQKMEMVFEMQNYFSLDDALLSQIKKRQSSEKRFHDKIGTMKRYANLISHFPFVKFVGITGSSAKGLFEEEGDVDYFIITETGKLWICRTLLILFKKVFLLNSHRYFCLNYFVDSNSLAIPDQNVYAAHEILAMAPVNNPELFQRFREENKWTKDYFPAWEKTNLNFQQKVLSRYWLTKLVEVLFNNRFGSWVDDRCFHITLNTWRKRFPKLKRADFDLRFRSQKNVSKHHPRGFQQKVLAHLNDSMNHIDVLT